RTRMTHQNVPTTFLPGASGFLGHYCLRDLLRRGRRVVAMLRPPLPDSACRLAGLLRDIGVEIEPLQACGQLVLVEGLLPHGLPEPRWGRTDDILNCAASLQLLAQ